MKINIQLKGGITPKKNKETDAGYDLFVPEDTYIEPNSRQVVPLGFCMELPIGYGASIRPRSGYSSKGMDGYETYEEDYIGTRTYYNNTTNGKDYTPKRYTKADVLLGLCDSGYRGIYGAIIRNDGEGFWITKGTRIAQMTVTKCEELQFNEVEELSESDRGENGYGSSNK